MRKGYTEPSNYFPKEVLKKYPLTEDKPKAKKSTKKSTTKKSK